MRTQRRLSAAVAVVLACYVCSSVVEATVPRTSSPNELPSTTYRRLAGSSNSPKSTSTRTQRTSRSPSPRNRLSPKKSPSRKQSPSRRKQPSPKRSPATKPSSSPRRPPRKSPSRPSPTRPHTSPPRSSPPSRKRSPYTTKLHSPTGSVRSPKPQCYHGPYVNCQDTNAPKLQRAGALDPDTPAGPPRLLPNDSSITTIQPGESYYLSGNYTFTSLIVAGTLTCGPPNAPPTPITISVIYMLIQGSFVCGRPGQPYTAPVTITLSGNGVADGTKAIIVTGNMSLVGTRRSTWTSITSTIKPTDKTFTTQHKVDWTAGETIMMSPTGFNFQEHEVRDIQSVVDNPSGPGSLVTVTAAFTLAHWGVMQSFSNPAGRTWQVDERAQVGLLSRKIVIQGDESSEATQVGGIITIMEGGNAWVQYVQMRRMGQAGTLGSYPIHWHLLGERRGNYVIGSVIWKSWNRCVTIHGTDSILVERNICFDHIGHGYMLEDNCEINNVFRYNLGALSRKPPTMAAGTIDTDFDTLATFWIVNPLNHFIGNVVAGSQGAGYWMTFSKASINHCLTRKIKPGINPSKSSFGTFRDNIVHSGALGMAMQGAVCNGTRSTLCTGSWNGPDLPVVQNLTVTKITQPIQATWIRIDPQVLFQDCKWADNIASTLFSGKQIVQDSIFVGESANTISGKITGVSWAFGVYDGPAAVVASHFTGFPTEAKRRFTVFAVIGAEYKAWPFYIKDVTMDATIPPKQRFSWRQNMSTSEGFSQGIIDPDGTIYGTPNSIIFPPLAASRLSAGSFQDPGFTVPANLCTLKTDFKVYICPNTIKWGQLRLANMYPAPSPGASIPFSRPIVDVTRSDGLRASIDNARIRSTIYFPVLVNQPDKYAYTISYLRSPAALRRNATTQVPLPFLVTLNNCEAGDTAYVTLVMPSDNLQWSVCQGKAELVAPTTTGVLTFSLQAGGGAPSPTLLNLKNGGVSVRVCASGLTPETYVKCAC